MGTRYRHCPIPHVCNLLLLRGDVMKGIDCVEVYAWFLIVLGVIILVGGAIEIYGG